MQLPRGKYKPEVEGAKPVIGSDNPRNGRGANRKWKVETEVKIENRKLKINPGNRE